MLRIREVADERGLDPEDVIEFLHDFLEFTETSDLAGLKEALAASNSLEVKDKAHSIKGAAANLKLDEIASTARDIEMHARSGKLDAVPALLEQLEAGLATLKKLLQDSPVNS